MKNIILFSLLLMATFLFAQETTVAEPTIGQTYATDVGQNEKAYSPVPVTREAINRSKLAYNAKCRIHYTENEKDVYLDCHDLYIEDGTGKYFAVTFLKVKGGVKVVKLTEIKGFRQKTALR